MYVQIKIYAQKMSRSTFACPMLHHVRSNTCDTRALTPEAAGRLLPRLKRTHWLRSTALAVRRSIALEARSSYQFELLALALKDLTHHGSSPPSHLYQNRQLAQAVLSQPCAFCAPYQVCTGFGMCVAPSETNRVRVRVRVTKLVLVAVTCCIIVMSS